MVLWEKFKGVAGDFSWHKRQYGFYPAFALNGKTFTVSFCTVRVFFYSLFRKKERLGI